MSPPNQSLSKPELYKTLLDTGKDWILLMDYEERIIFCSASGRQITGYPCSDFISGTIRLADIVYPADQKAYEDFFAKSMCRESASTSLEYRIITRTGDIRWLRNDSHDLNTGEGLNVGRRFTIQDVTRQVVCLQESDHHLRQTQKLQRTVQQLNECSTLVDVAQKAMTAISEILDAAFSSLIFSEEAYPSPVKQPAAFSGPRIDILDSYTPWRNKGKKRRPVCFKDIDKMKIGIRKKKTLTARGIKSVLFIPLLRSDHFLGKMIIYFKSACACSEQAMGVCQVIAETLTSAVSRFMTLDEIRRAEQRYHSIVSNSAEGIYQSTTDGKFIMVNPAMVNMFGYSSEQEMLDIRDTSSLYWDRNERERLVAHTLDHKGRLKNYEVKMKRADGQPIWVLINSRIIKDDKGNTLYHEGTLLDITDRKQKERELWESEEKYQLLSDATFEAIFLSEKGICTGQNKSAEKMFGYTQEEAIGRPGTEWIIPQDRDLVKKHILSGYEKPYEVTALRKDGSTFPCEIQGRMFDYHGKKIRMTALRDISDRKAAETAHRQREEQIHSLVRLSRQLERIRDYKDLAAPLQEEIEKIIGFRTAWIYLFNDDCSYMHLISSATKRKFRINRQIQTIKVQGDRFLEEVAASTRIVIVNDARTDDRTDKNIVGTLNIRTIVNIPVILSNKRLGVIATGSFGSEGVKNLSVAEKEYLEAVARHIAVVIDRIRFISENHETTRRIAELADFNKNIISSAPVGIVTINRMGKLTSANETFLSIMGSPGLEETLKLCMNEKHVQRSGITRHFHKTFNTGKAFELENLPYTSYWGKKVIINVKGVPQKTKQGDITGLILVVEDVTKRHKAEQDLIRLKERAEESEKNYRTVINSVQEVIFRTDARGLWTFLNPAWKEITGFNVDESIGTLFLAYVHPEDREYNMREFRPLLERKKERCFHVVRYLKQKGGFCWMEVQARLITDQQNQIVGTAGTLTDITEKKQAEDALLESYKFNESLIRAIPFGMDIVDEDGRILFLSQNLQEEFGADAQSKKCWELYCDDKKQCRNCPLKKEIIVGKTEILEVQNVMGQKILQINHTGMIYQGKKAILETFQDISARKQAETALQQQLSFSRSLNQISENITGEEKRQRIFDTITTNAGETMQLDLCLIYKISYHDERIRSLSAWLNRKSENLHVTYRDFPLEQFKLSHKQLIKSKSWFISDIDKPNVFLTEEGSDHFLHKKMGIKSLLWHPLAVDKNGYYLLAFYHTRASHSWSKAELDFTAALARMTEITLMKMHFLEEQKNATAEISRLAAVVEQAGESIVITNLEGQIEYVNPAFEKVTGYSAREALGKNPRFLKSGVHDPSFYRQLWSTIQDGKVWNGKFIDKKKDGSVFTEDTIIFPVKNNQGKIINFCKIARDVSHEQELEEQLRQAQKMEAVGTLAGGVAHDFNNLLTVINGYADLALMKLKSDHPSYKDFKSIKNAGKKAAGLTSQLLAFSRKQVHKPEIIDLNQVVSSMENILRRLITEDIHMQTRLTDNLPPAKADPNQLEQILTNLVINARDAVHVVTKRNYRKKITIETGVEYLDEAYVSKHPGSNTGLHIFFSVSDNGIGMDEHVRKRIFEPFFTTKSKYKGTGLGLSMVYGIVKQNNGCIYLESEPGEGTTFKIYWPVTKERIVLQKDKIDARVISGSENVLVVEDDDAVRSFTVSALAALGYKVYQASNGQTALEMLKKENLSIDLIITDLIMPEMNGRELARQASGLSGRFKVIFVSGYTDDQISHDGSLDEEIHFIQKPFSIEELAREVRTVLEK